MTQVKAYGYFLTTPNKPLEKQEFTIDHIPEDHVLVEVAGCGLCHTDLTFFMDSVKTKHELPLILGHEISGKVIDASKNYEDWIGKNTIIPAVLPCGECELCKSGRDNICRDQKMPGNDFNGGFASHIVVPGRFLCELPENLGIHKLSGLSVIADAVTTPYQSLVRSGLKKGDLSIVLGVGGIGIYMVQNAKVLDSTVIAIDIDDRKLDVAKQSGADYTINTRDMDEREIKKKIQEIVNENNLPKIRWRVFETSGTAQAQKTAFSLLSFAGSLGVVGFTMEKINIRLSNIMAFDADVFGNWGCSPSHYPTVIDHVLSGKINISDHIEEKPLASINEIIPLALEHKLDKRIVFVP